MLWPFWLPFRRRRLLESGRYGSINELPAAEKINSSYVSRLLRLTLLAPDIVEAILDGRQPEGINLPGLMEPFSVAWEGQRRATLHGPVKSWLLIRNVEPTLALE